MNIPNSITVSRILMVPFFVFAFISDIPQGRIIAAAIFGAAAITDIIDGYLARKLKMTTKVGEALDPLADKLMQISAAICLFSGRLINPLVAFLYIFKEVSMIGMGVYGAANNAALIPAKWYGKLATVFFNFLVGATILINGINPALPDKRIFNLIFIAVLLLIYYAFVRYMILFFRANKKQPIKTEDI